MTFSVRYGVALLALVLPLSFQACSTKETPAPAPTTGSIEGVISPAGAVTTVTATTAGGLTFPAAPNASTGAFVIAALVPGPYSLSFTPASRYAAPAARTVAVLAGQVAAAGTVAVQGDGTPRGTMSWTVNGTTYSTTTLTGLVNNTNFDLSASASSGTPTDVVGLYMGNNSFGGSPGTYGLGSSPYIGAGYVRSVGGIPTLQYTTQNGSGTGSIVVSSFDRNARTLSGTFGFVAPGYNSTMGSAAVTNGTFSVSF